VQLLHKVIGSAYITRDCFHAWEKMAGQGVQVDFVPGARVQITLPGTQFPATIVQYIPERQRWAIQLDNGRTAAAKIDDMKFLALPDEWDINGISTPNVAGDSCCNNCMQASDKNWDSHCTNGQEPFWEVKDEYRRSTHDINDEEPARNRNAKGVGHCVEEQPHVSCNHVCVSCPTRHECRLKGSSDIEDFGDTNHDTYDF